MNQKSTKKGWGWNILYPSSHASQRKGKERSQLRILPTCRLEFLCWLDEETEAARWPTCLAASGAANPQCGGHCKPERNPVLSGQAGLLPVPSAKQRSPEDRSGERGEERTRWGRTGSGLDAGVFLGYENTSSITCPGPPETAHEWGLHFTSNPMPRRHMCSQELKKLKSSDEIGHCLPLSTRGGLRTNSGSLLYIGRIWITQPPTPKDH